MWRDAAAPLPSPHGTVHSGFGARAALLSGGGAVSLGICGGSALRPTHPGHLFMDNHV